MVPASITLDRLHDVIQIVMGWTYSHLHEFTIGNKRYTEYPESKEDGLVCGRYRLGGLIKQKGRTFRYLYDFGDGWIHDIELEKITDEDVKEAVCLAGKGTCPPEDCGGPWGYEELKEILSDPSNEQYKDMVEWLGLRDGEIWDPNEKVTF